MEQHTYRKWTLGLLLGLVLVLVACAAFVWRVDPCFYYRMPADRKPVFFSERYQTAGIVRNNPADVVLIGSSMAANSPPVHCRGHLLSAAGKAGNYRYQPHRLHRNGGGYHPPDRLHGGQALPCGRRRRRGGHAGGYCRRQGGG